MAGDERDEEGKYTRTYPDEAFLTAIDGVDVASTQAVADHVGCSYDLAYRRLHELEREGKIKKTDVGGSFLWDRSD